MEVFFVLGPGLAGLLIRLVVPLLAVGWLSREPRDPAAASTAGYVLGAYLCLLATDIALHVGLPQDGRRGPAGRPAAGEEGVAD